MCSLLCLGDVLSNDLCKLLEDSEDFNVMITVGEYPEQVFEAHSIILKARSPYFRRILKNSENHYKNYNLEKPNVLPQIFEQILKYIYGGKLLLDPKDNDMILKTAIVASEFELTDLCNLLQDHLLHLNIEWVKNNFALVYNSACHHEGLSKLLQYCNDKLRKDVETIFKSPNFTQLTEEVVLSLLRRDNLPMSEIDIWDNVFRWGIARSGIPNDDISKWKAEDFLTLKLTLEKCLPLIRFFQMPYREFSLKVMPFEKILPIGLVKEVQQYNFVPNRIPKFQLLPPRLGICESKIVAWKEMAIIASWIDRKDCKNKKWKPYDIGYLPYTFKLIFRASQNGFAPALFHKLCDNQGSTVTFIKLKGDRIVVGGYNPTSWQSTTSNGWSSTTESFIFSFTGPDFNRKIVSRVADSSNALYNYIAWGPHFGDGDLKLCVRYNQVNCNCIRKSYDYKIIDSQDWIIVEDYEVFQIGGDFVDLMA